MPPVNPERVVSHNNELITLLNPLPVTPVGGGGGGSTVITDIKDGAGDSVMDAANDAVRVTVVVLPGGLQGYEVDTPAGGTDKGTVLLAVFKPLGNDPLADTDGDYSPLQVNGDGSLKVAVTGTVTQAGVNDARPLGFFYDEGSWFALPPDSEAQVAITQFYAQHVHLRDANGVAVGTASNPLPVALTLVAPEAPARVALSTTSEVDLVSAPGAGLSVYVTDITGSNENSALSRIDLKEGPSGTIRYSFATAARGGGFAHSLRAAWKLPADTALTVQQSAVGSAYVTVNYFIAP